jgi:hypothetical protein
MSRTSVVPAAVPSVRKSSPPEALSVPMKYTKPPSTAWPCSTLRCVGAELAPEAPTVVLMSRTRLGVWAMTLLRLINVPADRARPNVNRVLRRFMNRAPFLRKRSRAPSTEKMDASVDEDLLDRDNVPRPVNDA